MSTAAAATNNHLNLRTMKLLDDDGDDDDGEKT
jgi:hypothetical protein